MLVYLLPVAPLAFLGLAVYLFRTQPRNKRVTIVVLGDIGRSPRMQYHAQSFTKEGFDVDFVGFGGSSPHQQILNNKKIHIYHLRELSKSIQKLPRLILYFIKVVWLTVTLFLTLLLVRKPSYLLIQNPPAIPTIFVCWLISVVRDTRLVIDWHNYGYTILGLTLGSNHLLVRIAAWYERFFGRYAHYNLCVTQSMREDLKQTWKINAVTLYDRPPVFFRKTDLYSQHKLFIKLSKNYEVLTNPKLENTGATTFTLPLPDGSIVLLPERPVLLVSSTSWTADEDFSVLLNALDKYEIKKREEEEESLPNILCMITGKGPEKAHYQSLIAQKTWRFVTIITPWLEADDYPRLLGSADLGVCLHKSSSGLDLPMKIVDMYGCGLPVCAIKYKSLPELVKHEQTGLVFSSEDELALQLQDLLRGFPEDCKKLAKFRENLKTFQSQRWDQTWKQSVLPLLK